MRSEDAASVLADDVNTESFDLFLPLMPQSGSSKIVFASNRDGSMQIYSMNSDGSGQTRLTYSGANDDYPRWSPNGTKIVFQSDRDNPDTGFFDIYVMNADGSGQTRLTTDPNDDSAPVWSPDGSKLAFQSARNGINYQIYVMNADGSGQMAISENTGNDIGNGNIGSDGQPAWSSDGTKIAFTSDRDHADTPSIYVMSANGLGQTRLTFYYDTRDEQPAWSPNGAKLAFVSTRDSTVETWQETDDDGNVITNKSRRSFECRERSFRSKSNPEKRGNG
jgi:Tol biopolymer transport system component